MSTVNIEVVVDAQTIYNTYQSNLGSFASPTPIAHEYIYMVTQPVFVTSTTPTTQATADLNITCNVGDNVRWTFSTLSQEVAMYALPYQISTFAGTNVMSTPLPIMLQPDEPIMTLPVPAAGPAYTGATQYDYIMQATITNNDAGTAEQYKVYFMLVQASSSGGLTTVGYFSWDPTITVNPPA
ncbi:AidA/PixA family protein [Azospirillum sp. TSH64]|uniref:AidA/PixA family protein n=1 Tax=Azospirillum sp. TSH64 TaxID=652740 RepID=UPI000D641AC2|nr:AidA/PixA family protein [Azospirillum sp. TSH64]